MLQLLKKLRSRFQGKEVTDADILNWANKKVKSSGRKSQMESFKVEDKLLFVTKYMCLYMYSCFAYWMLLHYFDRLVMTDFSNSYVG